MKTALYQGVGRIIRGVFSRGRAFLPLTERSPKLLRGGGGGTKRAIAYWGGVYPYPHGLAGVGGWGVGWREVGRYPCTPPTLTA